MSHCSDPKMSWYHGRMIELWYNHVFFLQHEPVHSLQLYPVADPYFWQSQFYFLHCIQCVKKIFLKLNFDFIVAEIRGVLEVLGCMRACVCLCDPLDLHEKSVVFYLISVCFEIVAATFFCSAKAQF